MRSAAPEFPAQPPGSDESLGAALASAADDEPTKPGVPALTALAALHELCDRMGHLERLRARRMLEDWLTCSLERQTLIQSVARELAAAEVLRTNA